MGRGTFDFANDKVVRVWEKRGGGWVTELGAEMDARRGEGGEECQSSGDRYSPRGTVSVAMLLCYCLAGSDRLHPMIDIRSAVTPFN
ncbi:hypothetical protein T05_13130 [Trichinella murrelli]|uniref:Uncharacterized protein n=1 Tax=Trichinella murrelli TaxID=144512 RepID=A0A0V0T5W2_9BILA|nr:hypothetical protein T05_13130 [Trichinella murrelli]